MVALSRTPFSVAQAREAGLRWDDLQTRRWTRTARGQYVSAALRQDAMLKLVAASLRMPAGYAFSGLTAAWLHRLDVPFRAPIEVTIPRELPVRARAGVTLRRAALRSSEVVVRHGFRTTSAMRTAADLGSRRDLIESVVALDMALHAGLIKLAELQEHVASNSGAKGIKRLRRAAGLAEPRSESPMETRLRLILIRGRLPRPEAQVELCDRNGRFIARVDLYFPDQRLVIEYDGSNHKERLDADLRRHNALLNAGYRVLRFTAVDLSSPKTVVAEVRQALRQRHG